MMSVEQETGIYESVRIPVELNDQLAQFFSRLKMEILEEAVRQVAERSPEAEQCVLQPHDVITVGRQAIMDAASKFEQTLCGNNEFDHVRRAS